MPRFFFDALNATRHVDEEGVELPDLHAACVEAVRLAGEGIRDDAARFEEGDNWKYTVRDEAGAPLLTLSFATTAPESLT